MWLFLSSVILYYTNREIQLLKLLDRGSWSWLTGAAAVGLDAPTAHPALLADPSFLCSNPSTAPPAAAQGSGLLWGCFGGSSSPERGGRLQPSA